MPVPEPASAPRHAGSPRVTVVVVPRERFSLALRSLESVFEHTTEPFELVYVDGGSPPPVAGWLEIQARERGFRLLREDRYLSPNRARNLGLARVTTPYVVFLDNDVVVTPGWLGSLVDCAEETGGDVVGPLTCQGLPLHHTVHCAGGESGVVEGEDGSRRLVEKIRRQGRPVAEVAGGLERCRTGLAEFHCVLVRRDLFDRIGPLDEALLNSKEHVDLCIQTARAGGTVWLEPASLVTYVFGPPLEWPDLPFYMLRWSDAWERASLDRLREKYGLKDDPWLDKRYRNVGWRRKAHLLRPLLRRLTRGRQPKTLEKGLVAVDRRLNAWITRRWERRERAAAR